MAKRDIFDTLQDQALVPPKARPSKSTPEFLLMYQQICETLEEYPQISHIYHPPYHVRILTPTVNLNYYFPKGTINLDRRPRFQERGQVALKKILDSIMKEFVNVKS